MSLFVERGISDVPLPPEMLNGHKETAIKFAVLWLVLSSEADRQEIQAEVVNRFFDSLTDDQVRWLEDTPLGTVAAQRKPRTHLIKDGVLSVPNYKKQIILQVEEIAPLVKGFSELVQEARKTSK